MSNSESGVPAAKSADMSNWQSAPFNIWAFHNVSKVVSSTDIANDPTNIWALPYSPVSLEAFEMSAPDGQSLDFNAFLRATSTDAIVILRDGKIAFESYFNGNSELVPHILMSATKSVVGLLVGILREKGAIDVDAPVARYVPEVVETAYGDATVQQLVDMRSGVKLDEHQLRQYDLATNWVPAVGEETKIGLQSFFQALSAPHRAHGGPFSYDSANTDLLGWVIARATGKTFGTLASELLWRPLGAEMPAYMTIDRFGLPRCTGGLCATARDFARIGQLVVQDGLRGSTEIIPKGWIADIEQNGDAEAWRTGEFAGGFGPIEMHYRSGWYVVREQPKIIFAMGIFGQNLFIDRANRIVVAKLSSLESPIDYAATGLTHRALPELWRCLLQP